MIPAELRRGRCLRAAAAVVLAAAALGPSPALAAPAGLLELPEQATITDLAELRDGSVGIAVGTGAGRFWRTATFRLNERGGIGRPLTVDRRSIYAAGAFGPDGELVLLRQTRTTAGRRASVELRTVSAAGALSGKPTTFRAGKRQAIRGDTPIVGPNGAAAVLLTETTATGHRLKLALRPAGANRFAAPVRLRSTTNAQAKLGDGTGDGVDVSFKVALSADGRGAVLALPESRTAGAPYLRQISSAGRLGPMIKLGLAAGRVTAGSLAFDNAGRLAFALASWEGGSTTWATNGRAYAGSLAAGASAASPLQELGKVSDGSENLILQLAPVSPDRSAVLIGAESRTDLRVIEGASSLTEVSVAGVGWREIEMRALPGGRLLFAWQQVGEGAGIYTSVRDPAGVVSVPKRLTPDLANGRTATLKDLAVLGDGRVAIAWTELSSVGSPDRTYAAIAAP